MCIHKHSSLSHASFPLNLHIANDQHWYINPPYLYSSVYEWAFHFSCLCTSHWFSFAGGSWNQPLHLKLVREKWEINGLLCKVQFLSKGREKIRKTTHSSSFHETSSSPSRKRSSCVEVKFASIWGGWVGRGQG